MPGFLTMPGAWTGWLLGWLAETSAVALALAVVAALLGRSRRLAPGPAARHALWLLVMLKLVTPPLVHWPRSAPTEITTAISTRAKAVPDVPDRTTPEVDGPVVTVAAIHEPRAVESSTRPSEVVPRPDPATRLAIPAISPAIRGGLAWGWLVGSVALAIGQARRIGRFRRLLGGGSEAPEWLAEEAEGVGRRIGVRVPPIRVVDGLGTPLLWCLGRPVLLVPADLLKTLDSDRWRSIVAHELAHLRRGDHWVRRLELVAGLAWWWNPVYWLARRRLDYEAELASDAWAVWALPEGRLTYAESLIRICANLSGARAPTPALGVAGTGRSFERRLTMILQGRVDRRVPAPSLLIAFGLALLALPTWTLAGPDEDPEPTAKAEVAVEVDEVESIAVIADEVESVAVAVADMDDDDEDEDEDDDAKGNKAKKSKAKAKAKAEQFEAMAEKLAAEMEAKFGPDSKFAKEMAELGKEMEKKFGPGSEFAKKMEAIGKGDGREVRA